MMKKLALISLLIFSAAVTQAQVELKGLVGMNFATLLGSDEDVSAKAGYQYGLGLLVGEKFYVEPGIQFVRNVRTISAEGMEFDFSQSLVKIPVYAGYHLVGGEGSPFALRAFAGPSVSIPGTIKKGENQISKDDVSNSIWSIDGGLGLDILFLFVEANYEYSFNDYFAESFTGNGKHGAFIVNAGIHIDF